MRAKNGHIVKIDDEECDNIHADVTKALQRVGQELGLTFKLSGVHYTPFGVTCKLAATIISDAGVDLQAKNLYLKNAEHYGLKPEWFDQEFVVLSETEPEKIRRIVGVNPSNRRYKVLLQFDENGSRHSSKSPASFVTRNFDSDHSVLHRVGLTKTDRLRVIASPNCEAIVNAVRRGVLTTPDQVMDLLASATGRSQQKSRI